MNVECSWTRRAATAAASAALAGICLTPSACARRPSSEIKPAQPGDVRLVYLNSKAPAAGLRVTQIVPGRAGEQIATSDADGRVQLYPDAAVTIADPEAGGVVLSSFRTETGVPASMPLPEAIRIAGKVPADRLKDLRLQVGFGRRVTAGQRFRNVFDRALAPNEEENRPFGLELPPSSSSWQAATVDAGGAFTTPWFPATDRPQLVAWNGAGQVAVEDVAFAGITARATLEAAALRFVQTRSVDIRFTTPSSGAGAATPAKPTKPASLGTTEIPGPPAHASTAAAIAAHVYLRDARGRAEDRDFIARYLSVLDRIDARTFTFASMMRPFTIAPGDDTLRYLPPWTDVDVRVMDAIVGDAHDLSLTLQETVARLDLRSEQLLPQAGGAALPLQGSVVSERAYRPITGATVVFSCYPDKFETTTDRFGNFVIPKACVGRESTLFVSHQEAKNAPVQATRTHVHRAGAVERVIITLPERNVPFAGGRPGGARGGASPGFASVEGASISPPLVPFPKSPFLSAGQPIPPGARYWVGGDEDGIPDVMVYHPREPYPAVEVLAAAWDQNVNLRIWLIVAETGDFDVWQTFSPCHMYVQKSVSFKANEPTWVQLIPIGNPTWVNQIVINRYPSPHNPIKKGTPVLFVNPIVEPDPVEVDADANGLATLETCNWQYALLYVGDQKQGCYEDRVTLNPFGIGAVRLGPCDQSSSPPVPLRTAAVR